MFRGFWNYREIEFKDRQHYFDSAHNIENSPPVFHSRYKQKNVIYKSEMEERINALIPKGQHHRWFRSMSSSQALTLSVFGNLILYDRLEILAGITGDDDKPLFTPIRSNTSDWQIEYSVNYLREPRPTSVDVFIENSPRVAIECKLMEKEIGPCSSGRDKKECDGKYEVEYGKQYPCYKTSREITYWKYIPHLFNWSDDKDYNPCPLLDSYQLVRNILAACVTKDEKLDPNNGHAVLIYDARNPAFQKGGAGDKIFQKVKSDLKNPSLLRKCSWQVILEAIKSDAALQWLASALENKYGLHAGA